MHMHIYANINYQGNFGFSLNEVPNEFKTRILVYAKKRKALKKHCIGYFVSHLPTNPFLVLGFPDGVSTKKKKFIFCLDFKLLFVL